MCPNPVGDADPVSSASAAVELTKGVPPHVEPAASTAAEVTHDVPLILQPEVLTRIQQHGWRKLASDMRWRLKLA